MSHIPLSFALDFLRCVRRNPAIDSAFLLGHEEDCHSLMVFRVDGASEEYATLDQVMGDVDAGLFKIFASKIARC